MTNLITTTWCWVVNIIQVKLLVQNVFPVFRQFLLDELVTKTGCAQEDRLNYDLKQPGSISQFANDVFPFKSVSYGVPPVLRVLDNIIHLEEVFQNLLVLVEHHFQLVTERTLVPDASE